MSIITSLFAFILTIGILVAIHEYGHFWVARKLGVKVLRYSVGFGKPLFTYISKDEDKVEYILAAIPFGGYVKMLDEREGEVPEDQRHRAFNTQSVWTRIAIVLAGPAANFIFAIIAYAAMFMVGVNGWQPYIGDVVDDTPAAQAGFEKMDKIVAVNGERVDSLSDAAILILDEYLSNPAEVSVKVEKENGTSAIRNMDMSSLKLLKDEGDYLEKAGLKPWLPYYPGIAMVMEGKPAALAGFKAKDRIIAGNGEVFTSVDSFIKLVNTNVGNELTLSILRDDKMMELKVTPIQYKDKDGDRGVIGIQVGRYVPKDVYEKLHTIVRYSPLEAFGQGAKKTWQMSTMTLSMIGKLVTGEASLKNVSGPVTIATYAGKSIVIGFSVFLGFLAIVSLSLGVMNLLPVPVLDGGHLLFYIIELIKGSPVSAAFEEMGMRIGVAMVGALMVLAFYNDILRLL